MFQMFKSVVVSDLKTLMQTPEPLVPVESWGRGEGSVSPVLGLPPTSLRLPLKSNTCDIMHVDIGCSASDCISPPRGRQEGLIRSLQINQAAAELCFYLWLSSAPPPGSTLHWLGGKLRIVHFWEITEGCRPDSPQHRCFLHAAWCR